VDVFIVTKNKIVDSKCLTESSPNLGRSGEVPKRHTLSVRFRSDRLRILLCGGVESGAARRMRARTPVELSMEKAGGEVVAGDVAEKAGGGGLRE
jgi:hypothetical protein